MGPHRILILSLCALDPCAASNHNRSDQTVGAGERSTAVHRGWEACVLSWLTVYLFQSALVVKCCAYQCLIHIYSHYLSVWRSRVTDRRWPHSADWPGCCLLLCEGLCAVMEQMSIDFSSPVLCCWCPCLSQECSTTSSSPRLTLRCCEIGLRWDFVCYIQLVNNCHCFCTAVCFTACVAAAGCKTVIHKVCCDFINLQNTLSTLLNVAQLWG